MNKLKLNIATFILCFNALLLAFPFSAIHHCDKDNQHHSENNVTNDHHCAICDITPLGLETEQHTFDFSLNALHFQFFDSYQLNFQNTTPQQHFNKGPPSMI